MPALSTADAIQRMREAANVTLGRRARRQRRLRGTLAVVCALTIVPAVLYLQGTDLANGAQTAILALSDDEASVGGEHPQPDLFANALHFEVLQWGVVESGSGDALVIEYSYQGLAAEGAYSLLARWAEQPSAPPTVGLQWTEDTQPWFEAATATAPLLATDGTTLVATPTTCATPAWIITPARTVCHGTEYLLLTEQPGVARYPNHVMLVRQGPDSRHADVSFALDSDQRRWRACDLLACLPPASG
ncbi:hypothetical protein D6T64_03290 [Cryobacterium melibiosiphilum]|uniref:Uncharacterized protein n=2 Tax=Cryobacterium melibiosiphilum TaxID=995039 RepID=A0A3A5MKY7_9MICO|nr:hypothetical protein D6T64_03290 [Cryobacterium melibiosiphilum]